MEQIKRYLPVYYTDENTNDYIAYLTDAYLLNTEKELFQFSFLAFHMLFMSYIYKVIWFLHKHKPEAVASFIRNNHLEDISHFFQLSIAGEKLALRALTQLVSHQNTIADFCISVDRRDHCAHASGYIQYSAQKIENFINEELEHIQKIQPLLNSYISDLYKHFLYENWNPDERSYSLPQEMIDAFLRAELLSLEDLLLLTKVDFSELHEKSNHPKIINIKCLHLSFLYLAQSYLGLEYNLFLSNLSLLMYGFNEQQELRISNVILDNFHNIIPTLTDEELKRFREITKFNIERV